MSPKLFLPILILIPLAVMTLVFFPPSSPSSPDPLAPPAGGEITAQNSQPAAAGLFLFYSITMRLLAGSWAAAWWQFRELWFLMAPLIAGFGVQIGLFSYIKFTSHSANNKMMAANSATSTISMIACCAHHATDIVPILGLSVLSLWLVNFQAPLLVAGIVSNAAGSIYLWRRLSRLRQT